MNREKWSYLTPPFGLLRDRIHDLHHGYFTLSAKMTTEYAVSFAHFAG